MNNNTLATALDFEEFEEVNADELACIFAETGMDREYGFFASEAAYKLWDNPAKYQLQYGALKYTKEEL